MAGPLIPGRRSKGSPAGSPIRRAPRDWPAILATIAALVVAITTLTVCAYFLYHAHQAAWPASRSS